jgi:thioesterase domain-containing protein
MPGSGGNVVYLYQLAKAMGTERPFYALPSKGLDGHCAPFTQVEEIASYAIQQIKEIQPMGPYSLGGHSFGALVAFEIAKQLQDRGEEIHFLGILDLPALAPNRLPLELHWDDSQWMAAIASILEVLSGQSLGLTQEDFVNQNKEEQLIVLKARLEETSLLPIGSDLVSVRGLVQVIWANGLAILNYSPKIGYCGLITLFHTKESYHDPIGVFENFQDDPTRGWSKLSSGKIEVYTVLGNHMTMLQLPHVQNLAKQLNVSLDKTDVKRSIYSDR